jgi:hypothetical protein
MFPGVGDDGADTFRELGADCVVVDRRRVWASPFNDFLVLTKEPIGSLFGLRRRAFDSRSINRNVVAAVATALLCGSDDVMGVVGKV